MRCSNWLRVLAVFVLLWLCVGFKVVLADPPAQGQLSTSGGERISETQLRTLLDTYIPESNAQSRLLILTQCYGGNMLDSFSSGLTKTTVLSATSEGQTARYGGYDDDAARALRPGAGRTSADVHAAGTAGKAPSETPTSQGGAVSLEPVSPSGAIQSRHILIYAGKPDSAPGRDVSQRDQIKSNFANQPPPTTTITTVGGAGTAGGWDYPGTAQGMTDALKSIQAKMGPNEQFIMFATDHGAEQSVVTPMCVANQCQANALSIPPEAHMGMMEDLFNQPALTLFTESMVGVESPSTVTVTVCQDMTGNCLIFSNQSFLPFDLNKDGDLLDPGDGYLVDIPLEETFALPLPLNITAVAAPSPNPLIIHQVGLESGAIAKGVEVTPAQARASLATSNGASIYDDELRALLDEYIPTANAHSALLVFTQCFGGDMLDNFAGRENTGVISATSPGGEEAQYGGYHDDAAAGLFPAAGRTSADVHAAGMAGKDPSEHPVSQGDPISLEPITGKVPITSRHVLFFAGESGELSAADIADRNKVVENFGGQSPTTTVTTVGFGGAGWDHPGTVEGLRAALQTIGAQMGPGEQFILFVGDHGDYDMVDDTPVCEPDGTCGSEPFDFPQSVQETMTGDNSNVPGVGVLSPQPVAGPVHVTACDSFFDVCYSGDIPLNQWIDLDLNGVVDKPGEGYYGRMDLPETFVLESEAVMVTVQVPPMLILRRISLESGEISRGMKKVFLPIIVR
ncbi:MAG TPA: hypothetical protein VFF78_05300 [Anaerolineaceae bacterium]|nr:hypothetical protein [Anaerolineaceae bacterium]